MSDEAMKKAIDDALREVNDPEAGINVVDMGLIYDVSFRPETGEVVIAMTLTTPACPAGEMIVAGVERRVQRVPGVGHVAVEVTFEPRWTPARISPEGRAALGF